MKDNYDVLVVGAGVIGLSIAFLLSKHRLRVGIIAPRKDKQTATTAAGAMIDAFGEIEKLDSPRELAKLDFEVKAQRRYPSWLEEIVEIHSYRNFR